MSSVYQDIREAVRQVIVELSLNGVGATQVRCRKRPSYFKEHDSLPLVVVSPVQRLNGAQTFGGSSIIRLYPVLVTLIAEQAEGVEDENWIEAAREQVEKALSVTTLAGASTVFGYDYEPNPSYDVSALAAYFDVTQLGFVYWSKEARNS